MRRLLRGWMQGSFVLITGYIWKYEGKPLQLQYEKEAGLLPDRKEK